MIHNLRQIFTEVKEGEVRGPEGEPDEEIGKKMVQRKRKKRRANGGCLGYPEAMKDVVSCEKARGSANRN